MADAKIVIKTATDDGGLKRLKAAFAEGSQKAAELKQQLKDLNKTTRNGTKATTEQRQALKDLRMALHSQKEANAAYSRAIKDTTKSIEAASQKSKEAAGDLSNYFRRSAAGLQRLQHSLSRSATH